MNYLRFLTPTLLAAAVAGMPAYTYAWEVPSFEDFFDLEDFQEDFQASAAAAASAADTAAAEAASASAAAAGSASAAAGGGSASAAATSASAVSVSAGFSPHHPHHVTHPHTDEHHDHHGHHHGHGASAAAASASAGGGSASAAAAAAAAASASTGGAVAVHHHDHHKHGDTGLSLEKTDNRDGNITRPGHTFTYRLTVKNTGSADIHDLEIEDTIPGDFEVKSALDNGDISGQTVRWTNVTLDAGATKTFTIEVRVRDNATLTEVCNTAFVHSHDHNLAVSDGDCITVERGAAVKAAVFVQPLAQRVEPASTIAGVPVPITAKTGAGMLGVGAGAALLSALGLSIRRLIG